MLASACEISSQVQPMFKKVLLGMAVLGFCNSVSAYEWSEREDLREYIRAAYPEVERAIQKNNYAELASFEHKLNLGLKIGLNYSSSTSFSGAIMIGSQWQIPSEYRPTFNFSFADLSFANLAGADLSACDLSNAKLRHADLRGAILNSENIRGADFSGADIHGASIKINDRIVPLTSSRAGNFNTVNKKENHKAWECHWFPKMEIRLGGDPHNNLYAKDGALDKLDRVAQTKSCEYEFRYNRYSVQEAPAWWGYCRDASQVACILPEPRQSVRWQDINFSVVDIQGLLVKAAGALVGDVEYFFDQELNSNDAETFIDGVKQLQQEGGPFVFSLDTNCILSYAVDSMQLQKTKEEPNKTIYEIKFAKPGTRYEHIIRCYKKRDSQGNVIESGWIGDSPAKLYRPIPVGDIYDKSTWQRRSPSDNPHVNLEIIYEIYMASLMDEQNSSSISCIHKKIE
jgi:hypothetical protein